MQRRHSITRRVAAGVLVAAALSLGACSNGDDSGGDGASAVVDTTAVPGDLTMRSIGGIETPASAKYGPAKGQPPQGYSHTPQGAALAAANGQAAIATATDEQWPDVVRTVTAPGPGRDEYASARTLLTVKGAVPEERASVLEGFQITSYDEAGAIVLLAMTSPSEGGAPPERTAYPVQLAWTGGDRKLVLPRQSDGIDAKPITTLDGFSLWKDN